MKCEKCRIGEAEFIWYQQVGFIGVCLNCVTPHFIKGAIQKREPLCINHQGDIDADLMEYFKGDLMTPEEYAYRENYERLLLDSGSGEERDFGGN